MSFEAEESSVFSGRPISLFRITMGAEVFRYTSTDETIVVIGETWNAIGISRPSFTLSPEDRDQQKSFTVPGDNQFCANYTESAPSEVPTIEVLEFHFGDATDVKQRWEGEVLEIDWINNAEHAVITARPFEGGLDARIPRNDAGLLCPYMVYDGFCTAVEAGANTFAGTASSVVGDTLVVSGLDASKGVGWATAGKIRVDSTGEVRIVMGHTATDAIEMGSPFKDDVTGLAVSVIAGCDRTLATCDTKFGIAIDFGGRPYISTKDPREGIN